MPSALLAVSIRRRPVYAQDRGRHDPRRGAEIRIFHGFGDPNIHWNGQTREVRRGAVIPGQP